MPCRLKGLKPKWIKDLLWDARGRVFGDCVKIIIGCMGEGLKVGKRRDQDALKRNKCGESRGKMEFKGLVE